MNDTVTLNDCIAYCKQRQRDIKKGINRGAQFPELKEFISDWKKRCIIYETLEKLAIEKKEQMG
jgi:hypothetical protein